MNGVPNVSILDGWWPEGCRHGETGWQIGVANPADDAFSDTAAIAIDARDRLLLHSVLRDEVLPTFADRSRWVAVMRASIEMAQWQFSADRMVEQYVQKVYSM
jgi:glycogen phosphorylase